MSGLDEFLDAKPLDEEELRQARLRRFGRDSEADEHSPAEPKTPAGDKSTDEVEDWLDEPAEPVLFDGDGGAPFTEFEGDEDAPARAEAQERRDEDAPPDEGEHERPELESVAEPNASEVEQDAVATDESDAVGYEDWADTEGDDWYECDDEYEATRTLDQVIEEPEPAAAPPAKAEKNNERPPEADGGTPEPEESKPQSEPRETNVVVSPGRTPRTRTSRDREPTPHERELEEVASYVRPDGSLPTLDDLRKQRRRNTLVAIAAMLVLMLLAPAALYLGRDENPRVEENVVTKVVPVENPATRRAAKPSAKRRDHNRRSQKLRQVETPRAAPAPAPIYQQVPADTGAGMGDLAPGGTSID